MNDPADLPKDPVTQYTQPTSVPTIPGKANSYTNTSTSPLNNPAPTNKTPHGLKKLFMAIAGNNFIQGIFIVIIVGFVAGAAYYIGWHRGYNNARNTCSYNYAYSCPAHYRPGVLYKPVINLYPIKPEQVNVKLIYPAGFSYTKPIYDPSSGWNVLATPNGQLTNLEDGQQYPYLVWEGNPPPLNINVRSGFIIPGSQTASFLSKELPVIGLSPSETQDFISYWLPKMRTSKFNLIHFMGNQYTNYAKLIVDPQPESELRVFMAFEPINKPISLTPQTFPVFHRLGFTVVEWGGTELTRN